MALPRVNAVVIGAGAGGGIVAKELAESGLTVVLLERGKLYSAFDCRKDDLRNHRTCALGNPFGPDDARNPRVVVDASGQEKVVLPSRPGYQNNAACVGGGTFSYGAMAWRFMEKDFRMKSTYGAPEGSTLEDWPISYDDLEPYYTKAEWEIGVSGDDRDNIFRAPRKRDLPMPPLLPVPREHQVLEPAAKALGLHPFHIPMLRNSVPYNGRGACMRCRWCVGFACEVHAKNGTHNTVIPKALATGNCVLRTECVAKEILLDSMGKPRAVGYYDPRDGYQEQEADVIVVSCSAIESARLLLNSKSKFFPNGIGNENDWVGRNLHGHAYPKAFGLFAEDTYDDVGPGASIAICDYNHGNPGLRGGAMLANEFIRLPYLMTTIRPPDVPRWGKAHKDYMRDFYKRCIQVCGPVQEMPVFDSRVQVDPKVKDAWAIPVARLSGLNHPHTLEIAEFISLRAEEWLKKAGAIRTWRQVTQRGLSAGQHQAGTCRMGKDPKTSVVDPSGRVHAVDNLYVADGSVNVTNGGFNPVLTIMAVSYRTADSIKKNWKGSR